MKGKQLVYFDHKNVNQYMFSRAIVTSTARASSVFLSSYGNTIFYQTQQVFS